MLEVQLEIHHFFTYCFRSVPVGYMGHNPKIGGFYPQNGWFISWKILLKWDDLGGPPLFLEHPYLKKEAPFPRPIIFMTSIWGDLG